MAFAHRQFAIDLDVRIDQNHVAHMARAHIVQTQHLRRGAYQRGDLLVVGLIRGAVHQRVQRIPSEFAAHAQHKQANHQRGDRVEHRVAQ